MLAPLFKYAGGKFDEYKNFKEFIPEHIRNYYEPFLGSAGVYLRLRNEGRISGQVYLNDFSYDVMNFYHAVADKDTLKSMLTLINNDWKKLPDLIDYLCDKYGAVFNAIIDKVPNSSISKDSVLADASLKLSGRPMNTYAAEHSVNMPLLVAKSVVDKANRFAGKTVDRNRDTIVHDCIATAVYQGFYFAIRMLYNASRVVAAHDAVQPEYNVAAEWLFLRDMCYGSIFRYSKKNEFNVPYGGRSYNNKTFDDKIKNYASDEYVNAFAGTAEHPVKLLQGDAAAMFDYVASEYGTDMTMDDFVFLDPPYDSTFSEYDGNAFGHDKHAELAERLKTLPCKWMMVIKNTDFIYGLYADWAKIASFDKQYAFQTNGQYDKNVKHLIITNY